MDDYNIFRPLAVHSMWAKSIFFENNSYRNFNTASIYVCIMFQVDISVIGQRSGVRKEAGVADAVVFQDTPSKPN